jgi:hypothetical protein
MRQRRFFFGLVIGALVLTSGCSGHSGIVPLLKETGVPVTPTPKDEIPLEVVTRSTAVSDPLPVHGSGVSYQDVEAALGLAVTTAAAPFAQNFKEKRPGGYQLTIEIMQADVDYSKGRLVMAMNVNATLRSRIGRVYLAQTQARCQQAGLVEAEQGGPVVYACMMRIGRDLGGWMGGLPL